jgi:hypothetical protein
MKDVAVCWSNHPNASEFIASEERCRLSQNHKPSIMISGCLANYCLSLVYPNLWIRVNHLCSHDSRYILLAYNLVNLRFTVL